MSDINKEIDKLKFKRAEERISKCLGDIENVLSKNEMTLMEVNMCFDELLKKYRIDSARKYIIQWDEKNGKN